MAFRLYHYPICPLSRQIRILLHELNIEFILLKENYWQRRVEFLKINPAATLPVYDENGLVVIGTYPIIEYLNEQYQNINFINNDIRSRCEIRRMIDWFNNKFYREVTKIIIDEKIIKMLSSSEPLRVDFVKIALNNLSKHLNYLNTILEKRSFIACENMSYADITASAHISALDYFGEIDWDSCPLLKQWYAILKCRLSFREILKDRIPGFSPATSYQDLDF